MASAVTTSKLLSNLAIKHYDFDPNVTTEVAVGYVDMQDFESFAASFFRTIGTSAATFKINAYSDTSGSNSTNVKTWSGSQPDAVGDQVWLECTAAEIVALDTSNVGLRYVSALISLATDTDEGVVTYIRGDAKRPYRARTADIVA